MGLAQFDFKEPCAGCYSHAAHITQKETKPCLNSAAIRRALVAQTANHATARLEPLRVRVTLRVDSKIVKTAAEAAVQVAWAAYFAATEIGGRDQTAGAGVIPTADLSGVVYSTALDGETAPAGLHAVAVATPSASTTPIALGHVATAGTWSITVTVVA